MKCDYLLGTRFALWVIKVFRSQEEHTWHWVVHFICVVDLSVGAEAGRVPEARMGNIGNFVSNNKIKWIFVEVRWLILCFRTFLF